MPNAIFKFAFVRGAGVQPYIYKGRTPAPRSGDQKIRKILLQKDLEMRSKRCNFEPEKRVVFAAFDILKPIHNLVRIVSQNAPILVTWHFDSFVSD